MIKKLVITPFQRFVNIESLGGMLLFGATLMALIWANSPYAHIYQSLWEYKIGLGTESFTLVKPLILWVNDGLMAVFFFLIGLEIKRELSIGELNSVRKASLPFIAAIGGMLVPVLLFLVLNSNPETAHGWGIPMATDIAFSLAILQILGKRVPLGLKVFLTAFAIIDDIGAVLVIAIFYSSSIDWMLLAYSLVPFLVLGYLSYKGIFFKYLTLLLGIVIWALFLKANIHPTIAGVLLAATVPIGRKVNIKAYTEELKSIANKIGSSSSTDGNVLSKEQISYIDSLEDWTADVQSPLQHLEHNLHPWVGYIIIPLFAFSNAGVSFGSNLDLDSYLIGDLVICLIVGNLLGITLMTYLGVKLKVAVLPDGVGFKQVIGAALLAGVGFTMSIFIANLAFTENQVYIDSAKIGILVGSLISGLLGYLVLRIGGNKYII